MSFSNPPHLVSLETRVCQRHGLGHSGRCVHIQLLDASMCMYVSWLCVRKMLVAKVTSVGEVELGVGLSLIHI